MDLDVKYVSVNSLIIDHPTLNFDDIYISHVSSFFKWVKPRTRINFEFHKISWSHLSQIWTSIVCDGKWHPWVYWLMKQHTNMSIYSCRAIKRTEMRKKVMKHIEALIDDDGSHAIMAPVTNSFSPLSSLWKFSKYMPILFLFLDSNISWNYGF